MVTISAQQLLTLWETAKDQHPVERALTLLTLVNKSPSEVLENLSIGQRNSELLQLRKVLIGQSIVCLVICPFCQESLEFTLNLNEFDQFASAATTTTQQVEIDEFEITFRSITSVDLLKVRNCTGITEASQQLLQQCVLSCRQFEQPIAIAQLPALTVDALVKKISACDPQAELLLNLTCSTCTGAWQAPFDIASIFWEEIKQKALQLLDEVHQLAFAYGWQESDILNLAPQRRQFYLKKVLNYHE